MAMLVTFGHGLRLMPIPSWFLAGPAVCAMRPRPAISSVTFANRLRNRIQLTSDGHHAYLNAVEDAFGEQIDYKTDECVLEKDGEPCCRYLDSLLSLQLRSHPPNASDESSDGCWSLSKALVNRGDAGFDQSVISAFHSRLLSLN